MNLLDEGIHIVKEFEGLSLKPYFCPAGILTIGYGNVVLVKGQAVSCIKGKKFGGKECILSSNPKEHGKQTTEKNALALLTEHLNIFQYSLRLELINRSCVIPDKCFSALVSMAYNIGISAMRRSTLLRKIITYQDELSDATNLFAIERQFGRWKRANGEILNGLVRRRQREFSLFKQGVLDI